MPKLYFSKNPNNSSSSFALDFLILSFPFFLVFLTILSVGHFYLLRFFKGKFNIEKLSGRKQIFTLLILSAITKIILVILLFLFFSGVWFLLYIFLR